MIGSSRFYRTDTPENGISIGFTFIARPYWGGEANLELKKLMINHIFEASDTVWFHIAPSNIRSQKATEKIGGQFSHEKVIGLSGIPEKWFFYKIDKANWQY